MTTLKPGERSILATFPSSTKAQKAAERLKTEGFLAKVDFVSKFPSLPDEHYNNPIAGQAVSLSALTLNSENGSSGDVGPLLAADPAVSGLAGGNELVGGNNFLLTVVTTEEHLAKAVSLIKACGGEV